MKGFLFQNYAPIGPVIAQTRPSGMSLERESVRLRTMAGIYGRRPFPQGVCKLSLKACTPLGGAR